MTSTDRSRHWLEAKHLLRWLLVATKGLSDESRERVNQEITSHFHDALDEGIRAGLPEDLAAKQAVESLGDPKAARRAFRRTYLTRYQARIARDLIEPRKRVWVLRVYLVVAAAGLVALHPRVSFREPFTRVGVVVLMATAVLLLATAVPRLYRRGRQRTAVALAAGSDGALWLSWLFLMAGPTRDDMDLWFLAGMFIFLAINYVPLLPKFGRRGTAT